MDPYRDTDPAPDGATQFTFTERLDQTLRRRWRGLAVAGFLTIWIASALYPPICLLLLSMVWAAALAAVLTSMADWKIRATPAADIAIAVGTGALLTFLNFGLWCVFHALGLN